ncbi:MAG: extracellular solute-binding protein, partial [Pseudomonadota bacterium]|nr:extracellular solute-binding protein [Pseudomonadota bacterium]
MRTARLSRRDVLKGSTALALTAFASPMRAAAPEASAITPQLIEAAKKEGKVVWYTSVDLPLAEKISKAFEAKFTGVAVHVERTGAERVFQRIGQEYASRIYAADAVNSSDAAHFIVWKRDGLLAPYLPEDVAKHYPAEHKDPDGMFASFRVWVSIIAYNTNLVKAEDAPKSFADLLEPKWIGKIVKAHPSYSGTIMTATYQMQRDLGWGYFEKLAQQKVMQVQSSADPPKRLALGERAVMADGNEYNIFQLKEAGQAVEPVYATEGSPLIVGPPGIFKNAPNPNAARLFANYSFTPECQQLIIDVGGLRSVHPQTKEKPGRRPFKD